ncbi:RNA-directed DNA polymerase (Reverse transcriptase), partial [Trifolium medium]|nr:RNA-directed DNA polymerase (Reverse transcriptase) [Trifolium medium]
VYKPGKLNKGADALSRVHEEGKLCHVVTSLHWKDEKILQTEIAEDKHLQQVIKDLQTDVNARPGYSYKQGVLLYEGILVLPNTSVMIPLLLAEFHETPQGGHSGFYRTYRRLAANVYWVGMKNTVQEFVKKCDVCQRQKYLASSPGGLLQPLPIPDRIWEDLSMDFITGLPKSKGFEAILVVVDSYHITTGQTPFEIVYGRAPPAITRWVQGETRVEAVQRELLDRDEAIRQLRAQLLRAQDRMKQQANK